MYIAVGKIVGTHSSKGFFKVIPYSGNLNRFLKLKTIYIEIDEETTGFIIEEIRLSKDSALIKLKGLENPEDVKQFVKKDLLVPFDQKIDLPKSTYFIHDLVGLKVFDIDNNYLGILNDVLRMGGNDIYQVFHEEKEILIPAVSEFIKEISLKDNKMKVQLIDGMLN